MNPAAQYTNLGTRFPRSLAGHSPNLKKVLVSTPILPQKWKRKRWGEEQRETEEQ